MYKNILISAAILMALNVAIGAFGAHSLKPILEANQRIDTFHTAVQYAFYNTLAIFAIGICAKLFPEIKFEIPFYLILAGIVIFSGSLYILSITNIKILGAVTPIGGVSFILGYLYLMKQFLSIK